MSLIGLIFVGLIVVFLLIIGSKVVPAVVEYIAIERAVQKIKNEATTVRDIQTAFERHRTIDDITSITAADLDITKEGDKIVISFGTATTFDHIGADGSYLGGSIATGVSLSLDALYNAAAMLPRIAIEPPPSDSVIGRDTVVGPGVRLEGEVTIGVVGKYVGLPDAYKSLNEALVHGGLANRVKVNIRWIDAEIFEGDDESQIIAALEPMHGILVPGGFGERGSEGKIASVRFARERNVPFFGICLGMQMACIEGARAAGFADAAERRRALVLARCWDDAAGWFFDEHWPSGRHTQAWTLAGAFPLYCGMVDDARAARMAGIIESRFLRPGGVVTTLVRSGEQWDAPNGWAPLQWVVVQGLRRYGHHRLADDIAERFIALVERVWQRTGKMMEKYDVCDMALEAGGGEYPVQDGFGWTNGVVRAFLAQQAR